MNADICKLLYPSRIYCVPERQLYTRVISCYQVAVVTLFWTQKRKLDVKYSARVCEVKSLKCGLLPPLNYTYFQWTEDRQDFEIQYLTIDA